MSWQFWLGVGSGSVGSWVGMWAAGRYLVPRFGAGGRHSDRGDRTR